MEFEKVKEIIVRVMDPQKPERFDFVTEQTNLSEDLGATSMEKFEIILGIEDEFVIEIKNNNTADFSTVGDLMEAIRATV